MDIEPQREESGSAGVGDVNYVYDNNHVEQEGQVDGQGQGQEFVPGSTARPGRTPPPPGVLGAIASSKRPYQRRKKRVKVKIDPTLQHKWTHSEANHLYETLEELEQKVAQCLQNQTLVYKLLEKVEELDERFLNYCSARRRSGFSSTLEALGSHQEQEVNVLASPVGKFVPARHSKVVVLTTSYNPGHLMKLATTTSQPLSQFEEHGQDQRQPQQVKARMECQPDGENEEGGSEENHIYEMENDENMGSQWSHEQSNLVGYAADSNTAASQPILPNSNATATSGGSSLIFNDTDPENADTEFNIADGNTTHDLNNVRRSRSCPICSKTIISSWGLNRHMLAVHSIGKPLECTICNLTFTKRDALQTHQFEAHASKTSGKSRKVIKEAKLGKRRVMTKDILYECSTCSRTFQTDEALKDHCKQEHPDPATPFRCQICVTGEFFDKSGMQQHVLTIHPVRGSARIVGVCPVCGNNTSTKWHLNRHMLSKHGIGIPKVCSICGMEFARKYRLRMHQLREHGAMSKDLDVRVSEGPFICEICKKAFKSKSTLVGHTPGCQGLKPFLCDECGQGFAHRSGVRQHKLSLHQKQKNHFCPVCEKGFFDLGHFNRHVLTHTGGKRNSKTRGSKLKKSKSFTERDVHQMPASIDSNSEPVEIIEVYLPEGDIASFNISQPQE